MALLYKRTFLTLLVLGLLTVPALAAPAAAPDSAAAFNIEAATQHYLNTLTPAQKASSDAYFEGATGCKSGGWCMRWVWQPYFWRWACPGL
ncbi:hypothetical protein [Hymenobacter radiodurans]|uniref:hypothetical protein n=1 Tax=Hymenobacter radiodurans TaxID=2496028 RepID=UPI00196BB155|nr:hypothetical protein [Hymenobacter radiodurans]